ncbi:3'(2'),5'-bisphosphate nucleotidase CysQ [Aurantimonas sp. Leaf443]|uniref:3'(2'),5'-bisphosphate nucleotidase CysQ n=1 Tax=Aurantimonas sp. Leaf443 TaxID=1736378 RepID=UPI0006FB76C4|nr:3'(2'),5'-bisphosphate nucleotidase CysQ [Aurantimonas sp. Leaf443]KQT87979.1 3'(2'),5'-bisphosphate nucleotidase CysQ [Aurantimonas sp. Leaf443]
MSDTPAVADDLALLKEAAREAGRIAMRFFRKDAQVWWKEGNSPVSEADLAVDGFLRETLLHARPDYGWLSEETAPLDSAASREGRFFVVDPIDGTRAFLRGDDDWCVSLAVVSGGRPVAGVIDAPSREEVYLATAESEASLNGETIRVAEPGRDDRLRLAMPDPMRRRLEGAPAGRGVEAQRNVPSLAYRLALVASGRIDATLIRPRACDWDIAAGDLILERAGGHLTAHGGGAPVYEIAGRRHGLLMAGPPWARGRLDELGAYLAD